MDLASESLLGSRLAELQPDDAILGEEEAFRPGTSGITWVVDPIDGTVNYLYGSPAYAVSVAAVAPTRPRPRPGHVDRARRVCVRPGGRTDLHGGPRAGRDARRGRPACGRGASLIDSLVGTASDTSPRGDACRDESSPNCCRRYVIFVAWVGITGPVRDRRRNARPALRARACSRGTWRPGALVAQEAGALVTGLRGQAAQEAMTVAGRPGRSRSERVPRGDRRRLRRVKTLHGACDEFGRASGSHRARKSCRIPPRAGTNSASRH